jgi:hypothetical protein
MNRGVLIELCGATAKVHHWVNAELLPDVKVNTDAMARTTQLVQEGFVKITVSIGVQILDADPRLRGSIILQAE